MYSCNIKDIVTPGICSTRYHDIIIYILYVT